MNDQEIFEIPAAPGLKFRVHIERDQHHENPWESEDGHGPVRRARTDEKRPGERVMWQDGGYAWLYDWQAACKLARAEKWNTQPFNDPNQVERAVTADFNRLKGYLTDEWHYVGVRVGMVNARGTPLGDTFDLWGIESDSPEYIGEVARELAAEASAAYIAEYEKGVKRDEEAAQLRADAERWRKFCRLAQRKDLGTEADPDTGKLTYPLYRRWFIDAKDLTAESPNAALDSLKEPTP